VCGLIQGNNYIITDGTEIPWVDSTAHNLLTPVHVPKQASEAPHNTSLIFSDIS
jgi:hypothetical protein